jgi:hypothetical protein
MDHPNAVTPFRLVGRVGKGGSGNSPRSLSPSTGIWRSGPPAGVGFWLPAPRRCAGLHGRLQAVSAPQRSRTVPGFPSTDHSGEVSQLIGATSADGRPLNLAWARLRIGRAPTCFRRDGAASKSRPLALRHGSYLLPLKLRLPSQAGDLVFKTPRARMLLRSCPRLPLGETATRRSIRDGLVRLRVPGCDPGTFRRHVSRPKPPGSDPPHWLTVATSGLEPTVFPHTARNPGRAGVTRLAAGFPVRTTLVVVLRTVAARLLVPTIARSEGSDTLRGNR